MMPEFSDVADLEGGGVRDLVLRGERKLLNRRRLQVLLPRIERGYRRSYDWKAVARQQRRAWRVGSTVGGWYRSDGVKVIVEWRILCQPQVGARTLQIVGDAVATSDYPARGCRIGKSDARHEIRPGRVVESTAIAIDSRIFDSTRLQVEVSLLIVDFVDRLVKLITKTDVES